MLLLLLLALPVHAVTFVFQNAQVMDPTTKTIKKESLVVVDGKIKSIQEKAPKLKDAKEINCEGKFIVPAFTDMHVHSTWGGNQGPGTVQSATLDDVRRFYLLSGVTSFLDLFADENMIFSERDKKNKSPGADLYAAGPMFTCTRGHGTEFPSRPRIVNNPKEASAAVEELAKKHPDVIKIVYDHARNYPSLNEETMRAIVSKASALHLKTVVHIGTWQDALEASKAGASVVTHLYESEIPDETIKMFKSKGTYEVPTLAYLTELGHVIDDPGFLSSTLLSALSPATFLESFRHPERLGPYFMGEAEKQKRDRASYYKSMKKMKDAGIKLMTGTDSGGAFATFFGFSLHREMEIMVDTGMPPWEALNAATSLPHKFLKRDLGIHEKDRADFVVLSESPLVNIKNTQTIEWVFHHGELVDPRSLIRR